MNEHAATALDDQFDAWVNAYHEALAVGRGASVSTPMSVELHSRLQKAQTCLDLLERVWPRQRRTDWPMPQQIGRFRVKRPLGHGGFGIVLLAEDPRLGREVALKVPRGEVLLHPDLRRRFVEEAQAAAGLSHPHIVAVHEAGETGSMLYIATEFCPGTTLAQWLKRRDRPADARAAAQLVATLAEAVHYIHSRGVLHRDLKPQNILLALPQGASENDPESFDLDGYVAKVSDFGLAKVLERDGNSTATGAALGTPRYMAPEQVQGRRKEIGWHTDVYALGTMLYEVLTGRAPFVGESDQEVWHRILVVDPVPPARLAPLPRDLETICLKCLHKDPQRRYPTALALAEDLKRFLTGVPIQARAVGLGERLVKWARRRPTAATLAAIGLLLALGLPPLGWLYEARVREARSQSALEEEKRLAAEQVAAINRYHSLVSQVAESVARPQLSWTWQGLDDLQEAARLDVAVRDPVRLRSLATRCLTGLDVRPVAVLAKGIQAFCAVFSPDGTRLAIGQELGLRENAVLVYDVATRQLLHDLRFPASATEIRTTGVRALTYSPDGRWLVAGTRNGELHTWDMEQIPPRHNSWKAHDARVIGLTVFPDGEILVSASNDGTLKVWQNPTSPRLIQSHDFKWTLSAMVFSPDRKLLAIGGDSASKLFEASGWIRSRGKLVEIDSFWASQPQLALSSDGRMLATVSDARSAILMIDAVLPIEHRQIQDAGLPDTTAHHQGQLSSTSFNGDGTLLVTGGMDRKVKFWEQGTGKILLEVPVVGTGNVYAAVSQRSPFLAVTGDEQTILYEVRYAHEARFIGHHRYTVRQAMFTGDGKGVICLTNESLLNNVPQWVGTLWELDSQRLQDSVNLEQPKGHISIVALLAAHSREMAFLIGAERAPIFYCWQPGGRIAPRRIEHALESSPQFSPDGTSLWAVLAGDNSDQVVAWSWPELTPRSTWRNKAAFAARGSSHIYCLAVGKDWLLVGTMDPAAKLVRLATNQVFKEWLDPGGPVMSVALSPDETLAALGTQKGTVLLARIPDGEVHQELGAHRDMVTAVGFHPDGQLLVTASKDKTVRIWQHVNSSFSEVLRLDFDRPVVTARFSPDGSHLAVLVQNEYAVRVWHLDRLRDRLAAMGLGW